MSSFGGTATGGLAKMGTTGQVLQGIGTAANNFNSAQSGNAGLTNIAPQKPGQGSEFTDIEAMLDRYMAKKAAVDQAAGTKVNY